MTDEVLRLCDLAAEALILCDVDDADSIGELIAALAALAAFFPNASGDHPALTALATAEGIELGDSGQLGAVEKAFRDTRKLAERLARDGVSPVDPGAASAGGDKRPANKKAPKKRRSLKEALSQEEGEALAAQGTSSQAMPLAGDEELMNDFCVRASEHLDDADARLLDLEQSPHDRETIDAVFRAFHTIKGMAGFLSLDEVSERAHHYESLLVSARTEGTAVADEVVDSLFVGVDEMRQLVSVIHCVAQPGSGAAEHSAPSGPVAAVATVSETAPIFAAVPSPSARGSASVKSQAASADSNGNDDRNAPVANGNGSSAREGTVRVAEARLDVLLDTIGELVIAESMTSASMREGADAQTVMSQLERLDKITRELQHMATSLRMVPLKATFGRMARLVRDLSHKSGKPVRFITTGEDTELDKAVVDRIQDPLIHALRNAVDHGIEDAAVRKAAGKPEEAQVHLRAYHAGGSIHIEIMDDGAGVNREAVIEKARKQGLLGPDEEPSRDQVLKLLFLPGLSTATEVTDVSGRGVGMDVVRRTVEDLRGRIDLTSEEGVGTTAAIRLPVTLAIIDGMVCRVGDERYTVPVLSIERSVRPNASDLSTVVGRGLMLDTGEGLLPIVRLHELLEVPGAEVDPTQAVVIIVSEGGQRAGLLVCELLGQQQTVIKPLGDGLPDQPGIAGGAIMPDGRVGLILDAAGLVRLANKREG